MPSHFPKGGRREGDSELGVNFCSKLDLPMLHSCARDDRAGDLAHSIFRGGTALPTLLSKSNSLEMMPGMGKAQMNQTWSLP